jgi:Tfp pilus assembly protein PilO
MKPKQFFYILLGGIVALVLVGGAGYYFALANVKATSDKLASQLAEQAAADKQTQYVSRIKNQYAREIMPILPLMDDALPRSKNQTEILVQLQRIAGESGLTISSVGFASPIGLPTATSQTVASGAVLALPISFQVQGSFAQLQTFLTKVEALNRFTNITTLSVSRPDKSKPIVYAMTVNAYVKP